MTNRCRAFHISLATAFLFESTCLAKMPPPSHLEFLTLKAQLIVQGRFTDRRHIQVERTFYGVVKPAQTVGIEGHSRLPMAAFETRHAAAKSEISGESTASVPVKGHPAVFFLNRKENSAVWSLCGWGIKWLIGDRAYAYTQFSNPGPCVLAPTGATTRLFYQKMHSELQKRGRFDEIRTREDLQSKIDGLVSLLRPSQSLLYYYEALKALRSLGPVAGKTLRDVAERPEFLKRRYELIAAIGGCKDKDSVPYLLGVIDEARQLLTPRDGHPSLHGLSEGETRALTEWRSAIYSAFLIGDERALPAFWEAVVWGAMHGRYQIVDYAASGLRKLPTRGNLPALSAALATMPRDADGMAGLAAGSVLSSLCEHRFAEVVPILALQLDHPDRDRARQARSALTAIVGEDLGQARGSWSEWYTSRVGEGKGQSSQARQEFRPVGRRSSEDGTGK